MANIKEMVSGDNLKRFFLKHGEKLVLGFVVLFVLITLTGTNWVSYQRRPAELEQKLVSADGVIESSPWTADEQEKYPPLNIQQDVNQMLAEMSHRPFSWNAPYVGSVFGTDEPRRDPEFLAVMNLLASSGRTTLAQNIAPATPEGTDTQMAENGAVTTKPDEKDDDLISDDLAPRANLRPAADDGMGMPGMANPYGGGTREEQVMVQYDPNQMIMDPAMMMEGGGMGLPPTVKGVPVRYISVRGVYDLRKQVLNYSKALNATESDAARLVEFLDFKLERQTADSAKGPWGEWEPVDIEVAIDYLKQTVDFDPDVVSVGVRNPVITMPLPARLMGVWRNNVNHPAVKNFELSDAEIEAEEALNRQILDEARKKNQGIKQRTAPGGFARQQLDVASMQQDYFNQMTDTRQLNKMFDDEFKGTTKEVREKLIQRIKAQVTAAGNLVLFRYIDFDLEPGKFYRYRVQLVLRNPNYDQPVERVVHPSVVEGETRETPMSEPSNVVSVSPDYAYFVTRVNPPRGVASEQADLQIFQWYDETGTMVKGTLTMEPGDFIAGTTKTHVLDPAAMKFEEKDSVKFTTQDLLVDALVVSRIDPRMHEDLKLPRTLTRGEVGVVPQVLVVDKDGKLAELDPVSMKASQDRYLAYYEDEKKPWEKLKDASKKQSQVSELDALLGGEDPAMMGMMGMMEGMEGATRLRGRRGNPIRRGGGGGAGGGMMGP